MRYARFTKWFEKTVGYYPTKSDSPACWNAHPDAVKEWELQPFETSYANGAFLVWRRYNPND